MSDFTIDLKRLRDTRKKNCPCKLKKTEDNVCPCIDFIETKKCICNVFMEVKQ